MLVIFVRTILLYMLVLMVVKVMGKGELSKMSPFQLIVVFMIAELASIPIESPDVSLITGITAIFTLLFIQVLVSYLSLKSERIKNFFSGRPSILIDKGQINHKELNKLRITINDLMEQLRLGNASSLSDVEYAIMESNGDLSITLKSISKPLTPKDISMKKPRETMPMVFISDGVLYKDNLIRSGWNEKRLNAELSLMGIEDNKKVFLAFCDSSSQLHTYLCIEGSEYAKEVTL